MIRSVLPWGRFALLTPLVVTTVLAVLAALCLTVVLSFQAQQDQALITHPTLTAYRESVLNPLFGRVMTRTLLMSAAVTLMTVVLAYPVAHFLAFRAQRSRTLLLILATAPSFASYLPKVFGWKVILGYAGVINSALLSLGVIDEPLTFLLYNPTAIVIVLSNAYVAFAILPIYVALQHIAPELREAAADLGARPFAVFLNITLPLSMPGVIAAALLIFVPTLGDYVTPTLVGGPDGTMIANLIQAQFGKANDWPAGSAIATMAMLLTGGLLGIAWMGMRLLKVMER